MTILERPTECHRALTSNPSAWLKSDTCRRILSNSLQWHVNTHYLSAAACKTCYRTPLETVYCTQPSANRLICQQNETQSGLFHSCLYKKLFIPEFLRLAAACLNSTSDQPFNVLHSSAGLNPIEHHNFIKALHNRPVQFIDKKAIVPWTSVLWTSISWTLIVTSPKTACTGFEAIFPALANSSTYP